MFREARILVLGCAIFVVFVVLCRGAFAQSAPPAPDMKNVTVQPGGTAFIAPVTVNVPRSAPPVVNVAAPQVRFDSPVVNVAPAEVKFPEELKVRSIGTSDVDIRGQLEITSMPDPPAPQSWCVRNLGWCGLVGAAIIGASVGTADALGAFDNEVSFK